MGGICCKPDTVNGRQNHDLGQVESDNKSKFTPTSDEAFATEQTL
jgi:hypothetical protein